MAEELEITARITLAEPPARVWQVALDWSRQHEWIWATRARGGTATGAATGAGAGADTTGGGVAGSLPSMLISPYSASSTAAAGIEDADVRGATAAAVGPRFATC